LVAAEQAVLITVMDIVKEGSAAVAVVVSITVLHIVQALKDLVEEVVKVLIPDNLVQLTETVPMEAKAAQTLVEELAADNGAIEAATVLLL
jgi:hypothetical protein